MLSKGQFKPVGEANPTIGSVGVLEQVEEDRVEVLVVDEGHKEEIRGVIQELKHVRYSCQLEYERLPNHFVDSSL